MNMNDPADVLARTVWGEARGDGRTGMEAVAAVILNRAANPRWWGRSVLGVCLARWQFSCWNADDPNLPKMRAATAATPMFTTAMLVAEEAITGTLRDQTDGADSYFAVGTPVPLWAAPDRYTRTILHHQFYRLEISHASVPVALSLLGNGSMHAPTAPAVADPADALNAAELAQLGLSASP